jgi:hypothetical protein
MAPPFAGVETGFKTWSRAARTMRLRWDALALPPRCTATPRSTRATATTGESMRLVVRDGAAAEPCVIHFAVPGRPLVGDIIHT